MRQVFLCRRSFVVGAFVVAAAVACAAVPAALAHALPLPPVAAARAAALEERPLFLEYALV